MFIINNHLYGKYSDSKIMFNKESLHPVYDYPKLVLHFDINGTITAADSTEPGTNFQNSNMVLSKSVYGTIHNDQWILNENYRQLTTGSISYYDYLKMVKNDPKYKSISFLFTEENQPGYPLRHLVPIIGQTTNNFLFESFILVLKTFPDAHIVFRTFGNDADEVIMNLTKNNFEKFSATKYFNLLHENNEPYFVGIGNCQKSGKKLNIGEFNNVLKKSAVPIVVLEDYAHWNSFGKKAEMGKVIQSDDDLVQIFFDDNQCISLYDGNNKNCHLIHVNTLEAIENPNYFVDKIIGLLPKGNKYHI